MEMLAERSPRAFCFNQLPPCLSEEKVHKALLKPHRPHLPQSPSLPLFPLPTHIPSPNTGGCSPLRPPQAPELLHPEFLLLFSHPVNVRLFREPMNCSMPGLPVPHYLPEFAQVHVHCISDAIQLSHPLMPSSPSTLNLFQHQGLFQ